MQKAAALCTLCVLLFLAYYRLSWTARVNSDGAADVLQAWDMLHGNVLLHGWWLSDVSFYTTELPQYALIEALVGPVPMAIHLAASMTYTLAVVLAALLAKGRATGRESAIRMLIAAGIMLAPQPGGGVAVLDLWLGHIGTSVPLLATCLLLDRAGNRRWACAAAGGLLTLALIADPLVLYAGVAPVVAVCSIRAYRSVVIHRRPIASAGFEITLALAALAAIPVAAGVLASIHGLGGFTLHPVPSGLASGQALPGQLALTAECILTLFGANFLGMSMGLNAGAAFAHLTGLILAAVAVWLGLRRFSRGTAADGPTVPDGLAVQVMTVTVPATLLAFAFSTLAIDPYSAREIALVLPFSAALAGRLLAGRLASRRLLPALGVVLCGYLAALAYGAARPPAATENQRIAGWLVARHLRYGLADYWHSSSVTLASGQRAEVRPVEWVGGTIAVDRWETNASWYDPRSHSADFVLLQLPPDKQSAQLAQVVETFGRPARTYRVGPCLVLTWHKNLLVGLRSR